MKEPFTFAPVRDALATEDKTKTYFGKPLRDVTLRHLVALETAEPEFFTRDLPNSRTAAALSLLTMPGTEALTMARQMAGTVPAVFAAGIPAETIAAEIARASEHLKSAFAPTLDIQPEKGDRPNQLGFVAQTLESLMHEYHLAPDATLKLPLKLILLLNTAATQRHGRSFRARPWAAEWRLKAARDSRPQPTTK